MGPDGFPLLREARADEEGEGVRGAVAEGVGVLVATGESADDGGGDEDVEHLVAAAVAASGASGASATMRSTKASRMGFSDRASRSSYALIREC